MQINNTFTDWKCSHYMDRDCQDIINTKFCFIFIGLGKKPNAKMLMQYFCLVTLFLYFVKCEYSCFLIWNSLLLQAQTMWYCLFFPTWRGKWQSVLWIAQTEYYQQIVKYVWSIMTEVFWNVLAGQRTKTLWMLTAALLRPLWYLSVSRHVGCLPCYIFPRYQSLAWQSKNWKDLLMKDKNICFPMYIIIYKLILKSTVKIKIFIYSRKS